MDVHETADLGLLPVPRSCRLTGGTAAPGRTMEIDADDARLVRAAERLYARYADDIAADGVPLRLTVRPGAHAQAEGYALTVAPDGIRITAGDAPGAFWGLQTLRQLIMLYGGALPCVVIDDAPQLRVRGFYHDVTRGKMPKGETLHDLVERLALFKVNELQLYVEHAYTFKEYEGIVSPDVQMTADETRQLDAWCKENFIELVPSLSTFGHLYHLLQSDRYRHLCELVDYQPRSHYYIERMWHHTIDPSNAESIRVIGSLIDQYVPLFSSRRFNICCDETFDLCTGRNAGRDKAETYFSFLLQVVDRVRSHGRQVMLWGDILLEHPELLPRLPKDVTVLNWDYNAVPNEERVRRMAQLGIPQVLCPGTWTWSFFSPFLNEAIPNITGMARLAAQYGAEGLLNTNWGDYFTPTPLSLTGYPLAIGAAVAWAPDTPIDAAFDRAAARLLYDDPTGDSVALLHTLSALQDGQLWLNLCWWYSDGKPLQLTAGELERRIAACADAADAAERLRRAGADPVFCADARIACRSVSLLCGIALAAVGGAPVPQAAHAAWEREFSAAWLRDNKQSELAQLIDEVRGMCDRAVQTKEGNDG